MTHSRARAREQKYMRDLQALSEAITCWFETHPGTEVTIDFGPKHVMVSGALPLASEYWKLSDDAKRLIEDVDQATGEQCTMMQFRIAFDMRAAS